MPEIYIKRMLFESQLTMKSLCTERQNMAPVDSISEKKHGGAYIQSAKCARRSLHVVFVRVGGGVEGKKKSAFSW